MNNEENSFCLFHMKDNRQKPEFKLVTENLQSIKVNLWHTLPHDIGGRALNKASGKMPETRRRTMAVIQVPLQWIKILNENKLFCSRACVSLRLTTLRKTLLKVVLWKVVAVVVLVRFFCIFLQSLWKLTTARRNRRVSVFDSVQQPLHCKDYVIIILSILLGSYFVLNINSSKYLSKPNLSLLLLNSVIMQKWGQRQPEVTDRHSRGGEGRIPYSLSLRRRNFSFLTPYWAIAFIHSKPKTSELPVTTRQATIPSENSRESKLLFQSSSPPHPLTDSFFLI